MFYRVAASSFRGNAMARYSVVVLSTQLYPFGIISIKQSSMTDRRTCEGRYSKMIKLHVKSKPKWNRRLFEEPPMQVLPPFHPVHNILNKDIFNESELETMTPDYQPSDLVLRMELRSAMVRDNHSHAVVRKPQLKAKTHLQKNIKEVSRNSQELSKIKESLRAKNIRNNVMFKNTRYSKNKGASKKEMHHINDNLQSAFIENEISFISELENNINSEREILSEIDKPLHREDDKKSASDDSIYVQEKTVTNSDDIKDLQTALTLMTIYSSNDESDVLNDGCNENHAKIEEINDRKTENIFTELADIETSDKNNIENPNLLKIISLTNVAKEEYLAKKYFYKWRQYKQCRNGMSEIRKQALNIFFQKLMKQKCVLSTGNFNNKNTVRNKAQLIARDQKSYQHRYQVQKNIIALQKVKLDEQNRIIEELKYNRIVEASKESADDMRDLLRGTYADMDRRMKPKIKSLTRELKLQEIEEPALVLHCLKVPQFLQRMERRAREREEKHALIRERRRQMEEERLRLKQQAELAKAEMDKEEKARRMKELKDKRKQEKIESIRRKQHAERMRAFRVMADLHYERNLSWRCGLAPWMKLMEMKRDDEVKAISHYEFQLKKNTLLHWLWHTEDMWMERNYIAEDWHRKKVLRKAFDALKMNHRVLVLKQQVADDYFELYVQQLVFRKFRKGVQLLKDERELKWQAAIKYYESNLLFRTLTHWRVLPALNRLQRERDTRKTRWRQKVLQVVPDYTPPEDD